MSNGRAWTDDEDTIIRKGYKRREPLQKICARLPGRSLDAMKHRAKRLRCVLRPHWTAREDRILRMEWGLVFSRRTLREKLPGRTWCAIARRAQALNLGSPARGLVSVKAAAIASGYSVLGLYGVIQRQGVIVRRHCGNHQETRVYTRLLVDMLDVEEAIARDIAEAAATETVAEAAARHGVRQSTMRDKLRAAGMTATTRRGQPARLDPRAVDAAMRGEIVPATEGVPVVVTMADYLRRGVARPLVPTTPEYAPPVRASDGAEEIADAGGTRLW